MVDCLLRVEPTGFVNSLVAENQREIKKKGWSHGC